MFTLNQASFLRLEFITVQFVVFRLWRLRFATLILDFDIFRQTYTIFEKQVKKVEGKFKNYIPTLNSNHFLATNYLILEKLFF